MKTFDNIQELWDYCLFCPFCLKSCRTMHVDIGPERKWKLIRSYHKDNEKLFIQCSFHGRDKISQVDYSINCLTNTYQVEISNVLCQFDADRIKDANCFFFYIQGICKECHKASAYGLDLNLEDNEITNIGLETESIYLLESKDKFHISHIHDRNVMLVSRCYFDDEGECVDSDHIIELPLIKLDLSDQEKLVDKIKTLILFS